MSAIKSLVDEGWVIVNPYRSVWHRGYFQTELDAQKFIDNFWDGDKKQIDKFTIVRGRATFEAFP